MISLYLGRYDKDGARYVQHVFVEKRISLIQSFHMEVAKLFDKQLKNVRHSLLTDFDQELESVMGREDEEFASFVSEAQARYENRFREAVKKVVIDGAQWEWKDQLEELRKGMTEKVKARERERVAQRTHRPDPDDDDDDSISLGEVVLGVLGVLALFL